jgi:Asp-tRNA(Asn)/Glu-tRNA(Gln) amidotransferase B subunit
LKALDITGAKSTFDEKLKNINEGIEKRKLKKIANDRQIQKAIAEILNLYDYDDSYLTLYANGNLDTILGFLN